MGTFGNFAVKAQMSGAVNVSAFLEKGDEAGAIIALVSSLPLSRLFMVVLLFISFVFLATTMDSSAFAAAEMTAVQTGSDDLAPRWLRLVWAVAAAVIAFIVVQLGGAQAVRSVCYIAGLPLALIVFLIMYSVFIMLREDYVRHSAIPFFTDYDLGKKNG